MGETSHVYLWRYEEVIFCDVISVLKYEKYKYKYKSHVACATYQIQHSVFPDSYNN